MKKESQISKKVLYSLLFIDRVVNLNLKANMRTKHRGLDFMTIL